LARYTAIKTNGWGFQTTNNGTAATQARSHWSTAAKTCPADRTHAALRDNAAAAAPTASEWRQ